MQNPYQQPTSEQDEFYSCIQQQFLDACRYNEQTIDQLLAMSELDLTYANTQNNNCLHMAAGNGHLPVVQKIMNEIAKREVKDVAVIINKQNADGNTPLHYAVLAKNLELVELLLKEGAKTNIKNECNRTAFKEAMEFSTGEIAEALAKVTEIEEEDLEVEEIAEMEGGNEKVEEEDYGELGERFKGIEIEEECEEEEVGEK